MYLRRLLETSKTLRSDNVQMDLQKAIKLTPFMITLYPELTYEGKYMQRDSTDPFSKKKICSQDL